MSMQHSSPFIASSLPTKKFVDPDACSVPFPEIAQQNVQMCLKNESKMSFFIFIKVDSGCFISLGSWILKQSVGNIGWRGRKHYFKVNHKGHNNQKHSQSSKLESQPSTSSYKEQSDQEYLLSWTVSHWCDFNNNEKSQ